LLDFPSGLPLEACELFVAVGDADFVAIAISQSGRGFRGSIDIVSKWELASELYGRTTSKVKSLQA
jgi:hypothetical protein